MLDKIICTQEQFQIFLESSDLNMSFQTKEYIRNLTKVSIGYENNRFIKIYLDNFKRTHYLSIESEDIGHVLGLYDKKLNMFYFVDGYEYEKLIKYDSHFSLYPKLSAIKAGAKTSFDKLLNQKIDNQKDNLKNITADYIDTLNDWQIKRLKIEIEKDIIYGDSATSEFHKEYEYNIENQQLINLLVDKQNEIERATTEYLLKHAESISHQLHKADYYKSYALFLKTDPVFQKRKKIIQSLNRSNMKTVNVLYLIDGEELQFKVTPNVQDMKEIYSYNITPLAQRNKFEEYTTQDILLDNIIRLTYGKKIIYEDLTISLSK